MFSPSCGVHGSAAVVAIPGTFIGLEHKPFEIIKILFKKVKEHKALPALNKLSTTP
jgi:hypothetical protein